MTSSSDRGAFEARIRTNRVFILGAGFSAAAGIPLTDELLRRALSLFAAECPGIYSRVAGYAMESIGADSHEFDISSVSFSDLCTFLEFIELREYGGGERWSANGSREKLALRFYLAKTIVDSTPCVESIPTLYRSFAEQLHPGDFVISFNWDGLLELALQAVGKTYTYDHSDESAITISKLHGSVNWHLGEPRCLDGMPPRLKWKTLDFGSGMMERSVCFCSELLNADTWSQARPLGEVEPYLVLPGYGKAFDIRANAPLWYKPEFIFAFTHDVYIIGLSLAPDDFFLRSFFLSNLPYIQDYSGVSGRRVVVINPDKTASENYKFVLRKNYSELWSQPFSLGHIAHMKK
ncbi:MAG TPA: hypothetical protein VFW68_04980 [Rhodocyclaceae bacterium]|nr:hypothetical protein [Rhodocyclaceae bacterium]